MVGSRELGGLMAKERKSATAEKSVRRDVKETAAVEQYWHAAGRPKSRKPPKDYKYVDELAHLQFELIKLDRKSTRLNSSHSQISYAVFCLKKKKKNKKKYNKDI